MVVEEKDYFLSILQIEVAIISKTLKPINKPIWRPIPDDYKHRQDLKFRTLENHLISKIPNAERLLDHAQEQAQFSYSSFRAESVQ